MPKLPVKEISAAIALIVGGVLAVEGGYVNDPRDPGGATNHGVTERVARANGYSGSMRELPKATASSIMVRQYIEAPGFMPVLERSPAVAEELIDTGYNAGPGRPSCWLQKSLNHLNSGGRDWPELVEDCKVGPGTINAFEALQRRRGVKGCEVLIKLLDAYQAAHYIKLAGKNAWGETFIFGWVDHRIGNVDLARCRKAPA